VAPVSETWLEIACEVPADLADVLAAYLTDLSGNGVCIENLNVDAFSPSEIIHTPNRTIRAYFGSGDDIDARLADITVFIEQLAARTPGLSLPKPVLSQVRAEDWSSSWKVNFKPLRVGRRLLIVPSWEAADANPDDIILQIDPGMAFGTGGHETTRLCLELLEQFMDGLANRPPSSVLDLGTGSGILAMAAARLGAGQVRAVDIDPQAVEVARENLAINGLTGRVECCSTPLESLTESYDLILANILAEELVRLAPLLTARLKEGGMLVLSGILSEKENLVRNGFSACPLEYRETRRQGEWVAMLYRKTGV
jgi:ribosomal protein L11 methyltransferase